MDLIIDGFRAALQMILDRDPEIMNIVANTLKVCLTSTLISIVIGLPIGIFIGLKQFFGKRVLLTFIHVGMALPPVVAGLGITMLLWRSGPLGDYGLLYSKTAIIMAQVLVSLPIIIGMTATTFQTLDRNFLLMIKSLGATRLQYVMLIVKQARYGLYAAVIAGLGRVFAEVGAATMVGGNLQGDTRILTTSIVMEVSKGNFDIAIALSMILMMITLVLTIILTTLQQRANSL